MLNAYWPFVRGKCVDPPVRNQAIPVLLALRFDFRHKLPRMSKDAEKSGALAEEERQDFIREMVKADLAAGRHSGIVTRFPPEPNGYLHIGHAKSICLNFGLAREFEGVCNLRFDDTNPTKEEQEYVDSIEQDLNWLIAGWAEHVKAPKVLFASDYFGQMYAYAVELIKGGKAFVCDQSAEDFARDRGTTTLPGTPSPNRDRSVEENLDLLGRMRNGEFNDGDKTVRAKIDMAAANIHLRDPALYRIRKAHHHRTGDVWCIYPTYDFAHCLEDSIERITHSLCTLEFEVHRPLYDWILDNLDVSQPQPRQTEFARLNLNYTVMSKRKLLQLVEDGRVAGWDDPRMPTISGMRRRGVPAAAIREFCIGTGVTKYKALTDVAVMEHTIRGVLNPISQRRLGVLRPLKLVITNYPEDKTEEREAINNPGNPDSGSRNLTFGRELFIERDDFAEVPPPKFFRLKPGGEVRLKYAYIIKCEEIIKDDAGELVEIRCTYDEGSHRGGPTSDRKVKGTIHWLSANNAIDAEVRLYDRLFDHEAPDAGEGDFTDHLNAKSLEVVSAKLEPGLAQTEVGDTVQFERLGYFCADADSTPDNPVYNRTITLRDAWAKKGKK
jgi:glutaminyl-tRNA synthetase